MNYFMFILVLACASEAFAQIDGYPLYENRVETNGSAFYAWRPFYSVSREKEGHWTKDYLWPMYTRKKFKEEQYSRFLFFGHSIDFAEESGRRRNWIIPFFFQGTSTEGRDYTALFPLGGTLYEFMGRDQISFVLFPLFAKSHINDVHTTTVLWPVGSKTSGNRVRRFRVWPFYAVSGLEGRYVKKSFLWPFFHTVQYTDEGNPGSGFMLVPLYGRISTKQGETHWLAPPFFRYARNEKQWNVHAPWPFIQLAEGPTRKRIFWPFYGKKNDHARTRKYWLWPLFWNMKNKYDSHERHWRFALPFFTFHKDVAAEQSADHEAGDVLFRHWKIWPLMSWESRPGYSRLRTLDIWPLRDTPGIERNWASWWTFYRRMHTAGKTEHQVLWGLYRQEKETEGFEWSLLKGFAGYKRTGTSLRYRFMFMWFGKKEWKP